MRYALLTCDDGTVNRTEPERVASLKAFADRMGDRLLSATRLRPVEAATSVRVRAGEVVIVDGPFAETKEQIVGVLVIECADLDEAIEAAAAITTARYGTVEIRPVWELE
jgi:hypothetical protein